jgi:hypothetical protein
MTVLFIRANRISADTKNKRATECKTPAHDPDHALDLSGRPTLHTPEQEQEQEEEYRDFRDAGLHVRRGD